MLAVMFVIFLFGACIGSFLNVVIIRTHEGGSFIHGRSACPVCHQSILARDLIPIVSFILLKGRCRNCHVRVSLQYTLVEFITGVLFVLFFLIGPQAAVLIRDWLFVSFLILIFVYDLRYMLIPDRFTIPAIILAMGFDLWLGILPMTNYLLGALVVGGFFLTQYLVSKGHWIGGGDIRLGTLMGLMLGWKIGLVALFFAYFSGALFAIILLSCRKANRKTEIPFGTFLAASTVGMLFMGESIMQWYLNIVT